MAEDHDNRRRHMRREKNRRTELVRAKENSESDEALKWGWYLRRLEGKSNGKNRKGKVQERIGKKPELSLQAHSSKDSEYTSDSSKSAEYEKHIAYVAESCGITRKDAKYAVDTIGPFHSLIAYAHSIYEHNKPKLTFRSTVNLVKEGIVSEELDMQDLAYRVEQEANRVLSTEPPKPFSNLPEDEKERVNHQLYGEPHNGEIVTVLEESLEQDI